MTVHSKLQPYIDAWTHSIESINELVSPLAEGEWNRRTECPYWSVRDIVSHVIGFECELLGDPRPIHTLPQRSAPRHQRDRPLHRGPGRRQAAPHRPGDDLGAGVHDHPPVPAAAQRVAAAGHRGAGDRRRARSRWRSSCGAASSTCGCTSRTCAGRWTSPATWPPPRRVLARDVLLRALPKARRARRGRRARSPRWSSTCTARWSSCGRSGSTPRAAATIDSAVSLGPAVTLRPGLGDLPAAADRAGAARGGRRPAQDRG